MEYITEYPDNKTLNPIPSITRETSLILILQSFPFSSLRFSMQSKLVYEHPTNAEKDEAVYLKEISIKWLCEFPIFVMDKNNRPRVWTSYFHLTQIVIYIEICTSENFDTNIDGNI